MPKVKIGGNETLLHEFNGRKAIRATKIVRGISSGWPEILRAMAAFTRQYEAENVVELDRATARSKFAPRPQLGLDGEPLRDEAGAIVMHDPLGHLTDEDWQRSGNTLKLPASPSFNEKVAAVFPVAFDLAEEQMLQLLALCVVDAEELGQAARSGGGEAVEELLKGRAEDLLDKADLGELIELAIVGAEMVHAQVRDKVEELGDRVGNLLRLFGLGQPTQATSDEEGSPTREPSSTSSPEPTDGTKSESSTERDGASSLSSAAA